jgi:site-specific recombinase XerC
MAAKSRAVAMAPLRGLCAWLARNHQLPFDPTAGDDLTIKGRPQRLPIAYSADELARIAAQTAAEHDDQRPVLRWPARDQAVLAMWSMLALVPGILRSWST